jgi:hypothetical protein
MVYGLRHTSLLAQAHRATRHAIGARNAENGRERDVIRTSIRPGSRLSPFLADDPQSVDPHVTDPHAAAAESHSGRRRREGMRAALYDVTMPRLVTLVHRIRENDVLRHVPELERDHGEIRKGRRCCPASTSWARIDDGMTKWLSPWLLPVAPIVAAMP